RFRNMIKIYIHSISAVYQGYVFVSCCILFFIIYRGSKERRLRLPPGPSFLYIMVALPRLIQNPERTIRHWCAQYGPLVTVRLFNRNIVYLNTQETIKAAFLKHKLAGRPQLFFFSQLTEGFGLSTRDYSDDFKVIKRFGMQVLKMTNFEDLAVFEARQCMEHLRRNTGKPCDLKTYIYNFTGNIISKTLFNTRFEYDDCEFRKVLLASERSLGIPEHSNAIKALLLFGWLRFIPPFTKVNKDFLKNQSSVLQFIEQHIQDHRIKFDSDKLSDFIDEYLYEQRLKGEKSISFEDKQLVMYLRDLFAAGIETTSNTIQWAILALLYYPEYAELIYGEIYKAFGSTGVPSMKDRGKLPLTCAFIQEIMRFRTLAPSGAPHRAVERTELNGYDIPPGTIVLANLWALHNDPQIWPEPQNFDPQRHIDIDGNFVPSHNILPFSVGSRYCMGEKIAKTEIFIFLVSFLQNFTVHRDPSFQWPREMEEVVMSALCCPHRYRVVLHNRN
uniref:Uncharacterized protein n=1 Tax=Ciona savignyi TaxID=51511 RepID=H2Y836_CIOSA